MTTPHPHWPWYVAEFVVAENRAGAAPQYTIHSYLIWAHTVENAYINAKNLELAMNEKLRAEHRAATGQDDVAYHCLGIHNLNTLHADTLENGIHLSVVTWPADTAPEVREMHQLALYQG